MTRKKSDRSVTRRFFPFILLLSAIAVVKGGSWANSTFIPRISFDYVSATWSSSTICVIVGNSASRTGAILRTTNSGSSWADVTQSTVNPYLLSDIAHVSFDDIPYYIVTGSSNGGFVFTSSDGVTFSAAKPVSLSGLNGVTIGSNGAAYAVGLGGYIYRSTFGSAWNDWTDISPTSKVIK